MEILVADINDIKELASVEVESKLQSFKENEPYATDYDGRLYRWQTYFEGESPVSAKPERITLKAVEVGKIIGYISGHLTNRYSKNAEIESFYILKEWQRKGIGSALLKHFSEWLINNDAKSLCVGIFPENPYQAFYAKYGAKYLNPHWMYWDNIIEKI
jgi:GNAT superfamily N-acetyltransferase